MRFHFPIWSLPNRKAETFALAAAVALGHLVGIGLSSAAREHIPDVIRILSDGAVFPGRIAVLLLPLLCSAGAVYVGRPVILLPIAFWKVLSFSYVFSGLSFSWTGAGWLVGCLSMLSGFLSLPVLCWYWLRHLDGRSFDLGGFLTAASLLLAVALADLWVISPFLLNIITF